MCLHRTIRVPRIILLSLFKFARSGARKEMTVSRSDEVNYLMKFVSHVFAWLCYPLKPLNFIARRDALDVSSGSVDTFVRVPDAIPGRHHFIHEDTCLTTIACNRSQMCDFNLR